ncbi:hypothetical protein AB4175_10510 [Vibrio cyclitrophicus]
MSDKESMLPMVRDAIDFEALMQKAKQTLHTYSQKVWSDMAIHDPGITLLESLAYGITDLGYRQTLPLNDLLTPAPEHQKEAGLFPLEFGPHQTLTCSPITEYDYRRAILDLHSTGTQEGYFLFSNAQLIREPDSERYQYWYNSKEREYGFAEPREDNTPISLELRGRYHLYVWPSRDTYQNAESAQAKLDAFLATHRNFGEAVSRVIWLEPEEVTVKTVIDLEEHVGTQSNIAAILAQIYQVTEAYVTPTVTRYVTSELHRKGMKIDTIYNGPWLQYGWIPTLPDSIEGETPVKVNLSGLTDALLAIDGVKAIRTLGTEQSESGHRWQWEASDVGKCPILWGTNPLETLAKGEVVKLLAVGEVQLMASESEIKAELTSTPLLVNEQSSLPYGQWRNLGKYDTATSVLPPCYDLMNPAFNAQQKALHQYLLGFEQWLANAYQHQALLPNLLSFKRQGCTVWGEQWPFTSEDVGSLVHAGYMDTLRRIVQENSQDREHELQIIDHLLGYFNDNVASEILSTSPQDFLQCQQGYLSRHPILTYDRANVQLGQVSALQQRIEAKLGLGDGESFTGQPDMKQLPFYLVEHPQLLPEQPHEKYFVLQTPVEAFEEELEGEAYVTLSSADVNHLQEGQLIDISFGNQGETFIIRGLMVRKVDRTNGRFSLRITDNDKLKRHLDTFLSNVPAQRGWTNSDVWLKDIDYALSYSMDQSLLDADEVRLTCFPFPVLASEGAEITIEYQITPDGMSLLTNSTIHAQITQVDRINNTLVIRHENGLEIPSEEESHRYFWHFSTNDLAIKDRFSFMLSVVMGKESVLHNTSDPYATERWIKKVILDEIPSHVGVLIHWMARADFNQFSQTYKHWLSFGGRIGDYGYDLMRMLSLGERPDELVGIEAMYVATEEQQEASIGSEGNEWNSEVIVQDELFYVPDEQPRNNNRA